jgi:hypothetical protein
MRGHYATQPSASEVASSLGDLLGGQQRSVYKAVRPPRLRRPAALLVPPDQPSDQIVPRAAHVPRPAEHLSWVPTREGHKCGTRRLRHNGLMRLGAVLALSSGLRALEVRVPVSPKHAMVMAWLDQGDVSRGLVERDTPKPSTPSRSRRPTASGCTTPDTCLRSAGEHLAPYPRRSSAATWRDPRSNGITE